MWKLLREVRRRQAIWRANERQQIQDQTSNPDNLPRNLVRLASGIFVSLKERKCSYGDYVFNFAFPENPNNYPKPILIPKDLPNTLWQLAAEVETSWPKGVKMLRVDAIRQPDNSIKIIELNPCWVDNIAALQAFYESYRFPFPSQESPTGIMSKLLWGQFPNLALTYCERSNGCKKDEIYGLAEYLRATGAISSIIVAPLREICQSEDGTISIRGVSITNLYLNGSFLMTDDLISQQEAIKKIKDSQERRKLNLAPAQFVELDRKSSLVWLSSQRPDIFVRTFSGADSLKGSNGPFVLKPTRAESLSGVRIVENPRELNEQELSEGYVFQPLITFTQRGIVCFDTKTKTIFEPTMVFEKVNLWIFEDKVVGALATYAPESLISDSGYNLPLIWEEK